MLRVAAVDEGDDHNEILFSNPAHTNARRKLTVRRSLDETETWDHGKLIHRGPSAYSDLVELHNGAGVLYEHGYTHRYERIRFAPQAPPVQQVTESPFHTIRPPSTGPAIPEPADRQSFSKFPGLPLCRPGHIVEAGESRRVRITNRFPTSFRRGAATMRTRRALSIAASIVVAVSLCEANGAELSGKQVLIGNEMTGWRADHGEWVNVDEAKLNPAAPKQLITGEGSGILVNGDTGRTKNLFTELEHGDVVAHVEFMVPQGSNSGVYFQGRYEIQVFDSWRVEELKHGDCGGIYQRWKDGAGYEGHPPRVNAARPPGAWQSFDVVFRAPRFDATGKKVANAKFVKVLHNGVLVHENVEVTGPTRAAAFSDEKPLGPLMLQGDHGPVAYRNLSIEPLGD